MAVIETLNASAPEKVAETVTVSMTRWFEKNRKLMLKTDVKPLFFFRIASLKQRWESAWNVTNNPSSNCKWRGKYQHCCRLGSTCRSPEIEVKGRFRHLHLCVPMHTHENHCSLSHVSLFIVWILTSLEEINCKGNENDLYEEFGVFVFDRNVRSHRCPIG